MENNVFEIIGRDTKTGIGRNGETYVIENLILNFHGKNAKIRAPRNVSANIGDHVRVGLGLVGFYGSLGVGAIVEQVIKKEEKNK